MAKNEAHGAKTAPSCSVNQKLGLHTLRAPPRAKLHQLLALFQRFPLSCRVLLRGQGGKRLKIQCQGLREKAHWATAALWPKIDLKNQQALCTAWGITLESAQAVLNIPRSRSGLLPLIKWLMVGSVV